MAKSAPARHFAHEVLESVSQSGDRGCSSGKAATPTQKSPDALSSRTRSSAYSTPSGWRDPLRLRVAGRVAAQGEDVAHAGVGVLADDLAQLGDRVVDRGEVPDRRQRGLAGDLLGHAPRCGRASTRRRRRSPRRRSGRSASSWRSTAQSLRSPSSRLGREELEGVRASPTRAARGSSWRPGMVEGSPRAMHRGYRHSDRAANCLDLPIRRGLDRRDPRPSVREDARDHARSTMTPLPPLDVEDLRERVQKCLDDFLASQDERARRGQPRPRRR